ncbi:MAG: hypothetical protein N3D75_03180 [Candidatus Aenigmarchaeota archaeon]|nr:hypothetical protein [Candidatus Aenigmarchaeota archaeon]
MTAIKDIIHKKPVNKILKVLYLEKKSGKPGLSLSEISKKTGIERHKLAGMIEVLALIGLVTFFQMGMSKMVFPTQNLLKLKHI